ncbi:MAG TPA: hypothetical protein VH349_10505 [Ktedonobacterales bacterium]|jgi:hypothetical protein
MIFLPHTTPAPDTTQTPFSRVAPALRSALIVGVAGGFTLATILTLTAAFHVPLGSWWRALVQTHGFLQLYGWAGLFALGVGAYVLPRLRGAPLALTGVLGWILGLHLASLIFRFACQPLAALTPSGLPRAGLIVSGVLEVAAVGLIYTCALLTLRHGPPLTQRPAFVKVLPLFGIALFSLGAATVVNLVNMARLAQSSSGAVAEPGDTLNVTLGLFGFLAPIALAMSAQMLPTYAGLMSFPQKLLWTLTGLYASGLLLYLSGMIAWSFGQVWSPLATGLGWIALGAALLTFFGYCVALMRRRGQMPAHLARRSPTPNHLRRAYRLHVLTQEQKFGPFVALIASAYLWGALAALLLLVDGAVLLASGTIVIPMDAIRHSLALGFITLLICGIAPRMLTGFSGANIRSAGLVTATLWLGNAAALLRLSSYWLPPLVGDGTTLQAALFGLSGPLGLALIACLAINLWPATRNAPHTLDSAS